MEFKNHHCLENSVYSSLVAQNHMNSAHFTYSTFYAYKIYLINAQ